MPDGPVVLKGLGVHTDVQCTGLGKKLRSVDRYTSERWSKGLKGLARV